MDTNIISNTNYDQAIKWCHETISSGHAMLFSLKPFHQEISTASKKFGISFEVRREWRIATFAHGTLLSYLYMQHQQNTIGTTLSL